MTDSQRGPRLMATALAAVLLATAALVVLPMATTPGYSEPRQGEHEQAVDAAFNPATTAYVVTSGAGGDLPGCGAISAIDTNTGQILYQSPHLGSRHGLTASEDFTTFVAGRGAGGGMLTILDARAARPSDWIAHEAWTPSGPLRIAGEAVQIQDDDLYLGMVGKSEHGSGLGRVGLSRFRDTTERQDVNPIDGFYSTRREQVIQIIPDPYRRRLSVLSMESRLPQDPTEAIETYDMRVHTVDTDVMAARIAPLVLPPLVVDEPPGAGLREVGIHTWSQNGRLAWATMLYAGGKVYGPEGQYLVVNRWLRPELIIADLKRHRGANSVMTATLPADFTIVGAVAANHGWINPGLLAVHAGDKIAVFDADPWTTALRERARLDITAVVSPLTDDRRMMSGPLAWSADGSQLIAAGNEGDAEVLIIDVEECGDRMSLRHAVAACPYENYNGAAGFVTANGRLDPPASQPEVCPTPAWWPDEEPVGSPFVVGLPWAQAGQ